MAYSSQSYQVIDKNWNAIPNVFRHTGATEKITSSGSSVQGAVYDRDTLVQIVADGTLYYLVGVNPTATSDEWLLGSLAGQQTMIPSGYRIAVISASGTAHLHVGVLE